MSETKKTSDDDVRLGKCTRCGVTVQVLTKPGLYLMNSFPIAATINDPRDWFGNEYGGRNIHLCSPECMASFILDKVTESGTHYRRSATFNWAILASALKAAERSRRELAEDFLSAHAQCEH